MIASSMFLTRSMICKQISSFHNSQSYCNHNAICVIKTESFLFYNYRDAVLISGIADDCKGLLGLQRIVQDCNVSRYYFGIKLIVAIVQYLWQHARISGYDCSCRDPRTKDNLCNPQSYRNHNAIRDIKSAPLC